jgi:hypothetical protein
VFFDFGLLVFDFGFADCSGAGLGLCSEIGAGSRFTQTNTSPSTNSMPGLLIGGALFGRLLRGSERHSHRNFLGAVWIFMPLPKGGDSRIIKQRRASGLGDCDISNQSGILVELEQVLAGSAQM